MKCPKINTNDFFIHATFRYSKLFNYKSLYTLQRHLLVKTSTLIMWKWTVFLHLVSEPQMGQTFLALESDSFQSKMIVFRPSLSPKKGKQKTKKFPLHGNVSWLCANNVANMTFKLRFDSFFVKQDTCAHISGNRVTIA